MTLVEIALAVTVFGIVSVAASMIISTGAGVFRVTTTGTGMQTRAQGLVERVEDALSRTGEGRYFPDPGDDVGTSTISFQEVVEVADGEATWGPLNRIAFELEEGEEANEEDDNGNGLVDEGIVVLTRDVDGPDETRTVLCHGVAALLEGESDNGLDDNDNGLSDEPGFCLQRAGNVLTVRVTLERPGPDGLQRHTLESSTRMRN